MAEQRREERFKEGNKVTIEQIRDHNEESDKKISFALTEDISFRGIKVLVESSFPVDSLLKIGLTLSKPDTRIDVRGKVRWANRLSPELYEVGIELDVGTLPRSDVRRLLEHLYGEEL